MTKADTDRIDIPGLDVAKAKRYSRTRLVVLIASTLWSVVRLAWFASDSRALRLKEAIDRLLPDRPLTAPVFIALTTALSWLSALPISYIGGHAVERRFGLTKQTASGWVEDQLKGLLVGVLLQTPLLTAAFAVIRRRTRDWWLILAAASVPLTVVLSNLAPVLLMPLFNRFDPLRDEALAARIRALASRSGVRISDVFEMDMSRQSEKPNAMFTGLGNTKRIVLGDTLLSKFSEDEIEAVVAHELGHQVHGDIWRLIGFGAGAGFGLAWLLSRVSPPVLRRTSRQTGVTAPGDEASLPVLALLLTAMGFVMMPIQAAFSRAIERRTDRFAVELTRNGEAYAHAMERLAAESLADPDPPRPVVLMLYSHPPIVERIRAARETERRFREDGLAGSVSQIGGDSKATR
ncbi:MAG: M48 family metallopeptidase [Chloroflexi bacterium]|nr:M48 family metallopeptidase [Chloroflexota bacterium]